jgi:hypothetical protein
LPIVLGGLNEGQPSFDEPAPNLTPLACGALVRNTPRSRIDQHAIVSGGGLMFRLAGSSAVYSYDEARATVESYALATREIAPKKRWADAFEVEQIRLSGYWTYDCVPPSEGVLFSDLDLLVTAGLNARVDARTVALLRSFADRAAEHLDAAHTAQPDFLDYSRDELGGDPPADTAGRYLNEAWRQGMATPKLGLARVHKLLHHKRPGLVPLIDNQTLKLLKPAAKTESCGLWQLIHDDLHRHADLFDRLSADFAKLADDVGGVPLTWLRLHDILVWMEVTGQRKRDEDRRHLSVS